VIKLFNHWIGWRTLLQVLFDFSFVFVAMIIAVLWVGAGLAVDVKMVLVYAVILAATMLVLNAWFGFYQRLHNRTIYQTRARAVLSLYLAVPLAYGLFVMLPVAEVSREFLQLSAMSAVFGMLINRVSSAHSSPTQMLVRRILVFGAGAKAQAVRKAVPLELAAIGNVEASAVVQVKSRIGGELLGVHFREGQDVTQGQLLFSIDPKPLEAALREAQARMERDRALLGKAEEDSRRYEGLVRQGIVSLEQFEQVSSNLAALRASVRADEAAVESARVQLGYTAIRAPISGRAGKLLVDRGNMVKANDDGPLLVLMQVSLLSKPSLPRPARRLSG